MVYHPWRKEEAGNQTREIMYTISLTNPLAPKTATVTETQVRLLSLKFQRDSAHFNFPNNAGTCNRASVTEFGNGSCFSSVETKCQHSSAQLSVQRKHVYRVIISLPKVYHESSFITVATYPAAQMTF